MRRLLPAALLLAASLLLLACKGDSPSSASTSASSSPPPAATTPPAPPPAETTPTATQPPAATPAPEPTGIEIIGSDEFVAWTQQALELLAGRAPDAYEAVLESIDIIESVEAGSAMYVEEKRYAVGEQTTYAPGYTPDQQLVWYAGTIVHDANHSALFAAGKPHTGKEAEVACLEVQKQALQLLTTDPLFITYVQSLIDGADDPNNQYWNQPNRHW